MAWTSDTGGPWSADWRNWPEADRFFQQAVRWTFPEPTRATFPVAAEVVGDQVTLRAQSVRADGSFGDLLDTRVTIVRPDGAARELPLPQTAPGTYSLATTDHRRRAPYRARFVQYESGGPAREETVGFTVLGGAEQRTVGINRALLDRLAARTGGQEILTPADAFARDSPPHGEQSHADLVVVRAGRAAAAAAGRGRPPVLRSGDARACSPLPLPPYHGAPRSPRPRKRERGCPIVCALAVDDAAASGII